MRIFSVVETDDEYGYDDLMGTYSSMDKARAIIKMLVSPIDGRHPYNGFCGLRVIETDTDDNQVFIFHND